MAASRLALLVADRVGFAGALDYLLQSSACLVQRCNLSLWVHGETPAQFDGARRVIQGAMEDRPHVRLVLTSASPATVDYLKASFPNDLACPSPWNRRATALRFLKRVNPGMLILLDEGRSLGSVTLAVLTSQGRAVAAINASGAIARHLPDVAGILVCVRNREFGLALQAAGVSARRICVTGSSDLEPRTSQQVSHAALREILGLTGDGPLLIAANIAEADELPAMEAFSAMREKWPESRLVIEPRSRRRSALISNEVRQRGWRALTRTSLAPSHAEQSWDVLVEEIPGEILALMPLSFTTLVGGASFEGETRATVAAAIAAGNRVMTVKNGKFTDADMHVSPNEGASSRILAALRTGLPESPTLPRVQQAWRVPSFRDRVGRSRAWKLAARTFMKRRIDNWSSLRQRLGHPKSILCLGNGPSSEDPRLERLAHDCLMRVNWRWKDRGFLTKPDVVFVGDAATVHKIPPCVFGLWDESIEYAVLLRHLVTHGLRRMEYLTMERLTPIAAPAAWSARPSNGALMVLAGAALQPERLTIGGMDLFLHRDGRYPGDLRSRNEYCHAHSRDTDLAIIELALESYRGEAVILSDILRESLSRYRERCHDNV